MNRIPLSFHRPTERRRREWKQSLGETQCVESIKTHHLLHFSTFAHRPACVHTAGKSDLNPTPSQIHIFKADCPRRKIGCIGSAHTGPQSSTRLTGCCSERRRCDVTNTAAAARARRRRGLSGAAVSPPRLVSETSFLLQSRDCCSLLIMSAPRRCRSETWNGALWPGASGLSAWSRTLRARRCV